MKNYTYIYIITLLILATTALTAQNSGYIFYNQHINIVNPAAVGMEHGHTVSVDIRNQWQGDRDAPQTQTLFTTHRINDRIALGLSIVNDKVFIQKQAGIYADFAYSLPIDEHSDLLMGLKAGGDFFNLDGSRINTYNMVYDPYLQTISGKFQPNVGVGLFYDHNDFFVGVSVPNLLASDDAKLEDGVMTRVADRMHAYANAGYYWRLSPDFTLKPMVQLQFAKDIDASHHVTLAGEYLKIAELGITYRTDKAVSGYLLFQIPKYYVAVGYGYESNLQSGLNMAARNSHEFLVQFKW
ncbi:MAG: PorP/SprF family type IX secretion system membrane protein [Capnocytophaga sp.]|nr:PorP/SprF family type IX secretion system membrane protein [Capnocytophaga sp.]